tara:strand:+ start:326 stop:532 length:207 start_codon:yes stop_codon:yes gene_type:complete
MDDKMIIPKSGYIPKQERMIGLVNKASNFNKDTKKYLVGELNKNISKSKKINKLKNPKFYGYTNIKKY